MIMMLVSDITLYSVILFPEEIKIEKCQDLMISIISPSVELYFGVICNMYMTEYLELRVQMTWHNLKSFFSLL